MLCENQCQATITLFVGNIFAICMYVCMSVCMYSTIFNLFLFYIHSSSSSRVTTTLQAI